MERIEIIGGGIAGLAFAAALDAQRFDVTVRERRADVPDVHTSLGIWPQARVALETIGAYHRLGGVASNVGAMSLRRHDGTPVLTVAVREGRLVARDDLLRALSDAVPPGVHRTVEHVERMPDTGAALTVGADGVHSVVRRRVAPRAAAARLTPYLAVRGVLPGRLPADWLGEYWGRGMLFGISPHPDGTNWYMAFRSDIGPRNVDPAEALALGERRYRQARGEKGWAPGIRHLFSAVDARSVLAQRIWTTPPLRSFHRGRAVLIGDAAHAMCPNLGRGACESIVDAITLAGLVNTLPIDDALAAYSRRRRGVTRRMQRGSELLMRLSIAEHGIRTRDALFGLVARRRERATSEAEATIGGGR